VSAPVLESAKDNEVQRALKARDAANTDDVERVDNVASWIVRQAKHSAAADESQSQNTKTRHGYADR
jgi:hypothetical protein